MTEVEYRANLAALVERANHVLALNRHDATCVVSRDFVVECRNAIAACVVCSSTPGSESE